MKTLNIIFIVVFVLFAAVQYNDPDPYVWMPIYLYAAWLCYLALRRRYNPWLYLPALLIYSVYAIYLFFKADGVWAWMHEHLSENIMQTMKATQPWIEATREFFGLLILIMALVINMTWLSKKLEPGTATIPPNA